VADRAKVIQPDTLVGVVTVELVVDAKAETTATRCGKWNVGG
jgi:hypothetical protein